MPGEYKPAKNAWKEGLVSSLETDLVRDLLETAEVDWTSVSAAFGPVNEFADYFEFVIPGAEGIWLPEVRAALAVGVVAKLIFSGWLVAGELDGDHVFRPWSSTPTESVARIAKTIFAATSPVAEIPAHWQFDITDEGHQELIRRERLEKPQRDRHPE